MEVIDANGNATYFKYDALGRQIERSNAPGDTWAFAYDSRDNMVLTTDAKGQRIEKTFDALNRLTRMIMFRADGTVEDDQNFAYDAMGRKTLAYDYDSSLAWVYDGANRVASATVHGDLAAGPHRMGSSGEVR